MLVATRDARQSFERRLTVIKVQHIGGTGTSGDVRSSRSWPRPVPSGSLMFDPPGSVSTARQLSGVSLSSVKPSSINPISLDDHVASAYSESIALSCSKFDR